MKRIILSGFLVLSLVVAFALSVAPSSAFQFQPNNSGFGPPGMVPGGGGPGGGFSGGGFFGGPEEWFGGGPDEEMFPFQDPFSLIPPELLSQIPQQVQAPIILKIQIVDGMVSGDISDCPMQMALQDLADRTGIVFEVWSQDNPLVSVHLNQVGFQEAIHQIAPDHNVVFYYDENKPECILFVQVFPRIRTVEQRGLLYLGAGEVAKTNEDVDILEQALKVLDGNARLEVKEKAINLLIHNKNDEAIKGLTGFLSDPSPEVRVAVIDIFAALGVHEALPAIVKNLKDTHPGVRQNAIAAVALLGDAKNIRDLKPLSTDKDPSVAGFADIAIKYLSTKAGE
jgi:hypothetical protein